MHITIPTDNPWVPLRILGLGKVAGDTVSADVFLMTDVRPSLFPDPALAGLAVDYDQKASASLLADLRSDKGMGWVPKSAWLTKVGIDVDPRLLKFDLAVDASGRGHPSVVAAGLQLPAPRPPAGGSLLPTAEQTIAWLPGLAFIGLGVVLVVGLLRYRPSSSGRS